MLEDAARDDSVQNAAAERKAGRIADDIDVFGDGEVQIENVRPVPNTARANVDDHGSRPQAIEEIRDTPAEARRLVRWAWESQMTPRKSRHARLIGPMPPMGLTGCGGWEHHRTAPVNRKASPAATTVQVCGFLLNGDLALRAREERAQPFWHCTGWREVPAVPVAKGVRVSSHDGWVPFQS